MTINIERLKTDAAYWDEVDVTKGKATHYCTQGGGFCTPNYIRHCDIPRPTKPAEWDGYVDADDEEQVWESGPPPVGVACEYTAVEYSSAHPSINPGNWYRCKVIAYYCGAVWTSDNGIRQLGNTRFRPIRTKERRQRDELQEIIEQYLDLGHSKAMSNDVVDAILSRYNLEPKP